MTYWDRATLKCRAKDVLKKSYWVAFAVMLLFSLIFGGSHSVSFNNLPNVNWQQSFHDFCFTEFWTSVWSAIMGAMAVGGIFSLAFRFFVRNAVEIGKDRFFMLSRYRSIKFEEIIYGFKGGHYMSNVKTLFIRDVYTWLWSLLFCIPGIIKHYSYWMIAYILAENPCISTERAFEISMCATEGEKWKMFVLDLSFLGWRLLSALTCFIGLWFLEPYYEATKAELYGALRYKAVTTGICTREEIGAEIETDRFD